MSLSKHPQHFITGEFKKKSVFLPDDEYARALDCLVKACSDILIFRERPGEVLEIMLGKRKVHPQPDWWFPCGGRLRTGESPLDSATRLFNRELGIQLEDKKRLILVGYYSFVWQFREQEPKDNGTADISCVLAIKFTQEELDKIVLAETEYEKQQWFPIEDILNDLTFHPALRTALSEFKAKRELLSLRESMENLSDAQIGQKMRNIFAQLN